MKILKQTRRRIMQRAWFFYNSKSYNSFSLCLRNSWSFERRLQKEAELQLKYVYQRESYLEDDRELFSTFADGTSSDIIFDASKPVIMFSMMNSYVVKIDGNRMLAFTNGKCVGDITNALWAWYYMKNNVNPTSEMKRKLFNFVSNNNQKVYDNDRKTFAA